MKTAISLAVVLGTLTTLLALPPAAPQTGKVLLLDNDLLIEGEISRQGEEYSVKRPGGGEVTIPARRAVALLQSRREAFDLLKDRRKPDDVEARVKLARWGLIHQLHPEALQEAEAALKLRPEDPQVQVLVRGLQKLIEKPMPLSTPAAPPLSEEDVTIPPEFNATAYGPFATRVQPLLMNLCASCHATGRGGSYRLVRVFEAASNRKGTLQNLAATLGQINRDKATGSPILLKSITAHGEATRAPIHDPSSSAYALLENWVATAVRFQEAPSSDRGVFATNAKPLLLEPDSTSPEGKRPIATVKPPLIGGNTRVEEASEPNKKATPAKATQFGEDAPPVSKKEKEKDSPLPKDEFDPLIFNQDQGKNPKK